MSIVFLISGLIMAIGNECLYILGDISAERAIVHILVAIVVMMGAICMRMEDKT